MSALVDSLRTTQQTNATCRSQDAIHQTIALASDYWIKERRGRHWQIISIDLYLTWSSLKEETYTGYSTKGTAKFNPMQFMGQRFTHTLFIVETDYLSPSWVLATIMPRLDNTCRLLNIIRDFDEATVG